MRSTGTPGHSPGRPARRADRGRARRDALLGSRLPEVVLLEAGASGDPVAVLRAAQPAADVLVVLLAQPAPGPGGRTSPQQTPGLPPGAEQLASALGVDLHAEVRHAELDGAVGATHAVRAPAAGAPTSRLLLAGRGQGDPRGWRRAGAALARSLRGRSHAVVLAEVGTGADARALTEGLRLASYTFSRAAKAPPAARRPVGRVSLLLAAGTGDVHDQVGRARVTSRAVEVARDLANTPSNEKTPDWLARQAVALAEGTGLQVRVRDERELADEGFGGIVAVGMGSAAPPRLVEVSWAPEQVAGRRRLPHVVLVGKGITFDSGGLSLKPREAMVPMKTDMSGGAAVLAAMAALPALDLPVRVTGLVPAAENLPGASALRPGDVIRHYGGRTVEVFNTDAEGRLVLADALAYADSHLDPDVVVDLATLTGAASLGLGRRHAALFTDDDDLAGELVAAGEAAGERVWRLPLVEDYRPALDSAVADLANVARDKHVHGGAITAALFLREFAGTRRWAHVDIAGPARADGDEHELTKGGTGFGTRLLLRWLESRALRVRRAA